MHEDGQNVAGGSIYWCAYLPVFFKVELVDLLSVLLVAGATYIG